MDDSSSNIFGSSFEPSTLVDLLRWRASRGPEGLAYRFLRDDEDEIHVTYGELDRQARAVASALQRTGTAGDRALLLYPQGLDYLAGFFGCLYAGFIAVPAYPPRSDRTMERIGAIASDAAATVALSTTPMLSRLQHRFTQSDGALAREWLCTDAIPTGMENDWQEIDPAAQTLAFLQYTSGSTSTPKGVTVSHGNLVHNARMLQAALSSSSSSTFVSWLPLYHDMGLIASALQALYVGAPCVLLSPQAFVQKPIRWLQALSRYENCVTFAPNFAYDLCVRKIVPKARETLDLRGWRSALNGAEPIRRETLERFATAFEPYGFRREALCPGYGLAEATVFVTCGLPDSLPVVFHVGTEGLRQNQVIITAGDQEGSQPLVGCGRTWLDQRIVIVDPESRALCPPHHVGEIWIASPSVAQGYWNKVVESEYTFAARLAPDGEGPFLRTGDLGFFVDGELVVTGRLKDLLIIRGTNYYPQDIERTVEGCHAALRPECCAAFSVEECGEERVVVVQEVEREHRKLDVEEIAGAIRQAVAREYELRVHTIVLLNPSDIPKTSSGKIQRGACRDAYLSGQLDILGEWRAPAGDDGSAAGNTAKEDTAAEATNAARMPASEGIIREWLVSQLAQRLGVEPGQIDAREPFVSYGLDSLRAVTLAADLAAWLGRDLPPNLIWDYPTVEVLAGYLAKSEPISQPAARTAATNAVSAEPIAIVGLSLRFPGSKDPQAFWQLLHQGKDAVTEIPANRWDVETWYDPNPGVPGKMYTRWGSFVDNVDLFDCHFFGIPPAEAVRMDPQQRLALEVAWEALETAGCAPATLAGTQTGVFMGISISDYAQWQFRDIATLDTYASTGAALSVAANRVSYLLDLRGPSMAVDTACSSSLVAVHLACQSLRSGESTLALAGGVNLVLSPELHIAFSQARVMAADGRCKTFDAAADGYVRGEGCGIVVLKRLSDAVADGDNILAVIRGSAVTQDGRSNGITAPNGPAQQAVIQQALQNAGVSAGQISYVETHGTGTPLGDPIEVQALASVLQEGRSDAQPCAIGSVKTNIGHLEAAAGIAGLIKVVLSLEHEEIPPHLHLNEINPYLSIEKTPFMIPTEPYRWPRQSEPRRAGVSSFGIGGTNAHVIVEEAPVLPVSAPSRSAHLLLLSAKTHSALETASTNLATYLQDHPPISLADVAYTSQVGRRTFSHRRIAVCRTRDEAILALHSLAPPPEWTACTDTRDQPVVFLFPGQGSQYARMAAQLYQEEPRFRDQIDHCADLLLPQLELDLRTVWLADQSHRLDQTWLTQPVLFAHEYALAQLWMSWGIQPQAMLGHSLGEYVAACLAGVFSLADALALVSARGRMMQQLPSGAMLAVPCSEADLRPLLGPQLALAAVNGPGLCIVSGSHSAVDALEQQLARTGIVCRRLQTSHAFHSPLMEPMLDPFTALLRQFPLAPPQRPVVSNVTGTWLTAAQATDPTYWATHLRQTVRFGDGLCTLLTDAHPVLLEVGPGGTLSRIARRHPAITPDHLVLASVRDASEDGEDEAVLLTTLGKLWLAGCPIDWPSVHTEPRRRLPLPTYPFERERYWFTPAAALPPRPDRALAPPATWCSLPSWKRSPAPLPRDPAPVGCWLLLVDAIGLGTQLAARLTQLGQEVVLVTPGTQWDKRTAQAYVVQPAAQADYAALLDDLAATGRRPTHIVHCWTVTPDTHAPGWAGALPVQTLGFASLLALTQALVQPGDITPLDLVVVATNLHDVTGEEVLRPEKAPLLGLCTVIPQEHPQITCRTIDVVLPPPGSRQEGQLIDQLLAELLGTAIEPVLAYRGRHRWLPAIEPLPLPQLPGPPTRLRPEGVYLLTGGLGGIGLELATYLVETVRARVVLLGRSPLPPRLDWEAWLATHAAHDPVSQKLRRLLHLEERGADLLLLTADVADPDQMQAVLHRIDQRFGVLHGVIHAAGVLGGVSFRPLQELTLADCALQFQAKVVGTTVLAQILDGVALDFCLLMSSLASILGGVQFAAYAAANRFLDAFAQHQSRAGTTPWISVNWDAWQLETDVLPATGWGATLRQTAMTPAQGIAVLEQVLALDGVSQVVVATTDLQTRIDQWVTLAPLRVESPPQESSHRHPRPSLPTPYAAPRSELEETLAAIWQTLFGLDRVGIHDTFLALGGDSLLGIQLLSRIHAVFPVGLPLPTLFTHPTIADLALAIVERQAEQTDQAVLAQLVDELGQLSDEEADTLLATKRVCPERQL